MALERIKVCGFKSIRELDLELRPINVLIGANGSGKSNLLDVFPLVQAVRQGHADLYSAKRGGAEHVLHFGAAATSEIRVQLALADSSTYTFALHANERDRLFTHAERLSTADGNKLDLLYLTDEETEAEASLNRRVARWTAYRFHDSGPLSPPRCTRPVRDCRRLHGDAANLAPYLYRLKRHHGKAYRRICRLVRSAAAPISDFVLEPEEENADYIRLRWRYRDSDAHFDVASMSDGTLRFLALMTVLNQPVELRPDVILIDEPELGLHPVAVCVLAESVQAAAQESKVVLATQSPTLLDYFEPQDVVVVDLANGASEFRRLDGEDVDEWLEDYSLGQLWEKNHFGGRPV